MRPHRSRPARTRPAGVKAGRHIRPRPDGMRRRPHRSRPIRRILLSLAMLGTLAGITFVVRPSWAADTPPAYAALGDSYAAGLGTGSYDPASGACDRSPRSADALWAAQHPETTFTFAACLGATTGDVVNSQLSGLDANTTRVTVTIGGNDANFVGVLITCLFNSDNDCISAVTDAKTTMTANLPGALTATYSAIQAKAPKAHLIVVGYPRLFELTGSCPPFTMDLRKRTALNEGADTLDQIIAGRAAAAGATFVDVRTAFAGHGVCSADPWIQGLATSVTDSFHPNAEGYSAGYLPALLAVTD